MKDFKLFGGKEIDDLGVYLKEYYAQYPDIEIYIGTDSAQHGKITKYATAISLLHPGKGVHVIYRRTTIKRERDMFTRLWNEVEYTREVGEYVEETMKDVYERKDSNKKIPQLHLDFNKQAKYKSHVVHDLSVGYLKGFGFDVKTKPDSWTATFCADHLVQK
jgi:predicted RNase H-related nuclease YkuK (DUF458 family)